MAGRVTAGFKLSVVERKRGGRSVKPRLGITPQSAPPAVHPVCALWRMLEIPVQFIATSRACHYARTCSRIPSIRTRYKLVGEQDTRVFHRLFRMDTLTLRYFNVFGRRMGTEEAYLTVISSFLRTQRACEPLTIFGDGEQRRDFTRVRYVVRANLLAIDCAIADGRALNIGRGRNVSVNRIAELIGGHKIYQYPRPSGPRHILADYTQAQVVLGWRPEASTEEGLAELCRAS